MQLHQVIMTYRASGRCSAPRSGSESMAAEELGCCKHSPGLNLTADGGKASTVSGSSPRTKAQKWAKVQVSGKKVLLSLLARSVEGRRRGKLEVSRGEVQ